MKRRTFWVTVSDGKDVCGVSSMRPIRERHPGYNYEDVSVQEIHPGDVVLTKEMAEEIRAAMMPDCGYELRIQARQILDREMGDANG